MVLQCELSVCLMAFLSDSQYDCQFVFAQSMSKTSLLLKYETST